MMFLLYSVALSSAAHSRQIFKVCDTCVKNDTACRRYPSPLSLHMQVTTKSLLRGCAVLLLKLIRIAISLHLLPISCFMWCAIILISGSQFLGTLIPVLVRNCHLQNRYILYRFYRYMQIRTSVRAQERSDTEFW